MRLLLIAFAALGSSALAPVALHAQDAPTAARMWIFFDGKDDAASAPATEAALRRRALRGNGARGALDVPVSAGYVARIEALGVRVLHTSRWLNAASAALTPAQAEAVAALPFVRELGPVARFTPAETTREPARLWPLAVPAETPAAIDYGLSRAQLETMNAIPPLERGLSGRGVVLGFLDTEYGELAHPVFARLVAEGRLAGTRNFAPGPQSNRHGQNTLSTAVGYVEGQLVGPAYGATVLAAVTEFAPSETNAEEDAFVAGLEWLEANGADVVNVSLGYTVFDAGQHSYTPADLDGNTGVTTRAADAAASRGVVMVVSAGNEGCAAPTDCWYYVGTPADGDSVIAVGAVTPTRAKASFSSFGPTADGRIKPDVSAQGTAVRVATGTSGYAGASGTSFSSPLVAGVAALLLEVEPRLTPADVRAILRRTASQASAPDNRLGWGIVNADAAVLDAATFFPTANGAADVPGAVVGVRAVFNAATGASALLVRADAPVASARLVVYDLLGRARALLLDGPLGAGELRLALPDALEPGVYAYRLDGEGARAVGTVVVRR